MRLHVRPSLHGFTLRNVHLQERNSRIELPPVQYGRQGPWAINFWFKPSNESGFQFQYLFSHNSTEFANYTENAYAANQVCSTAMQSQFRKLQLQTACTMGMSIMCGSCSCVSFVSAYPRSSLLAVHKLSRRAEQRACDGTPCKLEHLLVLVFMVAS